MFQKKKLLRDYFIQKITKTIVKFYFQKSPTKVETFTSEIPRRLFIKAFGKNYNCRNANEEIFVFL